MQAKNFNLEILSLHPNRGHGTPELALGNSPPSRSVSHISKLKETDKKSKSVSHKSRNHASRQVVPAYSTRVHEFAVVLTPEPDRCADQCEV